MGFLITNDGKSWNNKMLSVYKSQNAPTMTPMEPVNDALGTLQGFTDAR